MLFVPTLSFLRREKEDPFLYETTESLLDGGIKEKEEPIGPSPVRDILPFSLQWLVAGAFLAVWFGLTFFLPVPGCAIGYLGPGGIGDYGQFPGCTGGAAGYIDSLIFGPNHIYCTPTCQEMYKTGCYDPEGTLGYLTSIFLCFLGVSCGRILLNFPLPKDRLYRMVFWGIFWGSLGTLLCKGSQDGGWIPINKNLWSPSFIFVMAGTGFLVLCLFLYFDRRARLVEWCSCEICWNEQHRFILRPRTFIWTIPFLFLRWDKFRLHTTTLFTPAHKFSRGIVLAPYCLHNVFEQIFCQHLI